MSGVATGATRGLPFASALPCFEVSHESSKTFMKVFISLVLLNDYKELNLSIDYKNKLSISVVKKTTQNL